MIKWGREEAREGGEERNSENKKIYRRAANFASEVDVRVVGVEERKKRVERSVEEGEFQTHSMSSTSRCHERTVG